MEENKTIEKVRRFLEEKEGLDLQSCYFITKKLNEQYWDEVKEETDLEEGDELDGDFADFEDEKGEIDIEDIDTSENPEDNTASLLETPKNIKIKRPKLTSKKAKKVTDEDKDEDNQVD